MVKSVMNLLHNLYYSYAIFSISFCIICMNYLILQFISYLSLAQNYFTNTVFL